MTNGKAVRLVQIDTPEVREGECYASQAKADLASLTPAGARIRLKADPALDGTDRYGRLLRYIYRGSRNVNVTLVRKGAATVWFYRGERGRHAGLLLRATGWHARACRGLRHLELPRPGRLKGAARMQ